MSFDEKIGCGVWIIFAGIILFNICYDEDKHPQTTSSTTPKKVQKVQQAIAPPQIVTTDEALRKIQRDLEKAGSPLEYLKQSNAAYNKLHHPTKTTKKIQYDCYDEGYDAGKCDGRTNRSYGYSYDDSGCNKYKYEEGYEDGYYSGQDEYETRVYEIKRMDDEDEAREALEALEDEYWE
jgi:hypothetical protein